MKKDTPLHSIQFNSISQFQCILNLENNRKNFTNKQIDKLGLIGGEPQPQYPQYPYMPPPQQQPPPPPQQPVASGGTSSLTGGDTHHQISANEAATV